MPATPQDFEVAAFFAFVLVFEVAERLRPARSVDRLAHLRTDLLSFGLALLLNRIATHTVTRGVEGMGPALVVNSLRELPSVAKIAVALVVVDLALYWIHRAQHRFEFLWRTHAWHHSIENLYWFSGFRTSLLHSLVYNVPQAAIPLFVFGMTPLEAGAAYSIGILVQFWEHTNLRVDLGPLRHVVMTPAYHRIHHSATVHRGKNLAPIFPFWDHLFGTFVDPHSVEEEFPLGLGERVPARRMPRMLLGV